MIENVCYNVTNINYLLQFKVTIVRTRTLTVSTSELIPNRNSLNSKHQDFVAGKGLKKKKKKKKKLGKTRG